MRIKTKSQTANLLFLLSGLLEYPQADFSERLEKAIAVLTDISPAVAEPLHEFKNRILAFSPEEHEEIFTRTFDLAPICIPYVSSYIYGDENFERGALMSRLSERYQECGFDTKGELPDHLALIMHFAPNCESDELKELLEFCLKDTVSKMHALLTEAENPYCFVLKIISDIVQAELEGRQLC